MLVGFDSFCNGCPYQYSKHIPNEFDYLRKNPLRTESNSSSTLLVFQSPGINEWLTGSPICSECNRSAAYKMRSAFRLARVSRFDFDITNIVQCFPGKRVWSFDYSSRDSKVLNKAVDCCSQRLAIEINRSNYKKIIAFGAPSKSALLRMDIGRRIDIEFAVHPSAPGVSANYLSKFLIA